MPFARRRFLLLRLSISASFDLFDRTRSAQSPRSDAWRIGARDWSFPLPRTLEITSCAVGSWSSLCVPRQAGSPPLRESCLCDNSKESPRPSPTRSPKHGKPDSAECRSASVHAWQITWTKSSEMPYPTRNRRLAALSRQPSIRPHAWLNSACSTWAKPFAGISRSTPGTSTSPVTRRRLSRRLAKGSPGRCPVRSTGWVSRIQALVCTNFERTASLEAAI